MKTIERKIMIFGCQQLAIDIINYIVNHNEAIGVTPDGYVVTAKIVHVVTHDEDRDKIFGDQFVHDYAQELGISCSRFNGKIDPEEIKKWNADIAFSVYYRKILKQEVIDLFPMGIINIHPGDLPKNRGPNPTFWAVRRGDYVSFSTLHYMDAGMDTGDVIAQQGSPIEGRTAFELNKHMMVVGFDLFKKEYANIMCDKNLRESQSHRHATCNIPVSDNMRFINWGESAGDIYNHIRAFAAPGKRARATTKTGKLVLDIDEVEVLDRTRDQRGPGSYRYENCELIIQTHSYPVLVKKFDCVIGALKSKGRFISGVP